MAPTFFIAVTLLLFYVYDCDSLDSNKEKDWWQKTILYQIYPRSFKDSNGDGVGDIAGITSKLEYLKDTGIQATWLSPIFQSPMVDFGYDISNFTAIHEEYGTMKDFEILMDEAKKLGIKIILDFVPNHSSNLCEWFKKSARREDGYDDFYVWHEGKVDENGTLGVPNNWVSVFEGSAWTWNQERSQYYLHQFTAEQPDLNYRNPKVLEAMDEVLRFWLNKGVDGFRVDAVNHMFEVDDFRDEPEIGVGKKGTYNYYNHIYTKDLIESYKIIYHWRELLDNYTKEHGGGTKIMLTEAYANITATMDYYQNKDGEKGSQIPFNFLLITNLDKNSDARDFVHTIQTWLSYMPVDGTANWVLGNHDRARVASRFGPERADGMNMMLMTLPGIAVTYNGEEIAMVDNRNISWEATVDPAAKRTGFSEDYIEISRDPVRTPFQWDGTENAGFTSGASTWLPVHPEFENLNLAKQQESDRSHYKLYKRLATLRRHATIQNGDFYARALNRNVLAYKRTLKGDDTFVVVINLADQEEIVNLELLGDIPDTMIVAATDSGSMYRDGTLIYSSRLALSAYDSLVLKGYTTSKGNQREDYGWTAVAIVNVAIALGFLYASFFPVIRKNL